MADGSTSFKTMSRITNKCCTGKQLTKLYETFTGNTTVCVYVNKIIIVQAARPPKLNRQNFTWTPYAAARIVDKAML